MASKSIKKTVVKYLNAVRRHGLPVSFGVLFGSHAKGNADRWSDIDLIVVSPYFDKHYDRKTMSRLWHLTVGVDTRIEPIPSGREEWEKDDSRAILEIARREGEIIV